MFSPGPSPRGRGNSKARSLGARRQAESLCRWKALSSPLNVRGRLLILFALTVSLAACGTKKDPPYASPKNEPIAALSQENDRENQTPHSEAEVPPERAPSPSPESRASVQTLHGSAKPSGGDGALAPSPLQMRPKGAQSPEGLGQGFGQPSGRGTGRVTEVVVEREQGIGPEAESPIGKHKRARSEKALGAPISLLPEGKAPVSGHEPSLKDRIQNYLIPSPEQEAAPEVSSFYYSPPTLDSSAKGEGEQKNLIVKGYEEIRDKIRETDIKAKAKVGYDIGDLGVIGLSARARVRPNDDKKTYSRIDSVSPRVALGRELFKMGDLAYGAGISNQRDLILTRQYDSQWKALTAPPLHLSVPIPLTAQKAQQMRLRDYASYFARMHLNFGSALGFASAGTLLQPLFNANYVLSGDFKVEIFKATEDHVLVRASALREHGPRMDVGIDLDYRLRVFQVKLIDKKIHKRLIPVRPANLSIGRVMGDLFVLEYVFDLSDPEGREAYNQVVNPKRWAHREFEVWNPTNKYAETVETMVADFTPAHVLALEDRELPLSERRVGHTTEAQSRYSRNSFQFHLGLRLFGLHVENHHTIQDFAFKDPEVGRWEHYRAANVNMTFDTDALFGLWGIENERESEALFRTSLEGEMEQMLELIFTYTRDKKTKFRKELTAVKRVARKMLPEAYHRDLHEKIGDPRLRDKNVRTRYQLVFHKEAIEEMRNASINGIRQSIDSFISRIDSTQYGGSKYEAYYGYFSPDSNYESYARLHDINIVYWRDKVAKSYKELLDVLPMILSRESGWSERQRWEAFIDLRNNQLFVELGSGLISRILYDHVKERPKRKFSDFATFTMTHRARGGAFYQFKVGRRPRSVTYQEIRALKNRILGRDFDPSDYVVEGL